MSDEQQKIFVICKNCGTGRWLLKPNSTKLQRKIAKSCRVCQTRKIKHGYSLYCVKCGTRYPSTVKSGKCPKCNPELMDGKFTYTCTCGRTYTTSKRYYLERIRRKITWCNQCKPAPRKKVEKPKKKPIKFKRKSFVLIPEKQGYKAEADARLRESVKHVSVEQYLAETGRQLTEPIPKQSKISWIERHV